MTAELKPCPFCGGEAEYFEASEDSLCVVCTNCGVTYVAKREAIAAWNRRVDQQAEIERLKAENDHLKAQLGKAIDALEGARMKGENW